MVLEEEKFEALWECDLRTLNSCINRMHGSRASDQGAETAPLAGGGAGSERTSRVRGRHAMNACKMAFAKHTLVELVRPRGRSGAGAVHVVTSARSRCGDAACSKAPPGRVTGVTNATPADGRVDNKTEVRVMHEMRPLL